MDEIAFAENIGKSILKHQYELYKRDTLDDEELILMIKTVINGISNHLELLDHKKSKINEMINNLRQYCKDIYVKEWIKNGEEGEDLNKAKSDGEKYFEYLFKYEKHP